MKTFILRAALVLFLLSGGAAIAQDAQRFQIYSGTASTSLGDVKAVFKLDTVTGETWMFYFGEAETNMPPVIAWVPVKNQLPTIAKKQ
jgi:hypothetical protein